MKTNPIIHAHFSALGKKGAKARRKKYGKKLYSELGKKGAAKRWHKKTLVKPA